jgi:DNA-binding IclR family transcriptional regulator
MAGAQRKAANGAVLQSATRTLSVLDALGRHPDGATAKALSADLGLHLSTTYHLLNTLLAAGYVVQDPISRQFLLGMRIPHLHQAFLATLQPPAGVLTLLQVLQETTGETIHLGRLHGQEVVAIAWVAGTRPDAVPTGYVGMSGPAHATAIGRAILAALPTPLLERFLAEADLGGGGLFPGSDAEWLRRELAQVRAQGYAVDRGDRANGLAGCLAAAVSRPDSPMPDAVAVMAPRSRFVRREATWIGSVTTIAQAASALHQTSEAVDETRRADGAAAAALAQAVAALRPPPLAEDRH